MGISGVSGFSSGAYAYRVNASPVDRPSTKMTYAPSFGGNFSYSYPPAAIVTLSDAAQTWLRYQRASL